MTNTNDLDYLFIQVKNVTEDSKDVTQCITLITVFSMYNHICSGEENHPIEAP